MYKHRNNCQFRKLRRDDLPMLLELKESSWVSQHTTAFLNDEDQEEWFNSIPSTSLYMICEHDPEEIDASVQSEDIGKELVGLLSITNINSINRTASIAGAIFVEKRNTDWVKKAWQAGTDFAFEMLNLNRLEGEVLETNVASLTLELAIGYTIEGKRRSAVFKSGCYLDSYTFGLLYADWVSSAYERYPGGICNTNFKRHKSASKILEKAGVKLEVEPIDRIGESQRAAVDLNSVLPEIIDVDWGNSPSAKEFSQVVS